MIRCFLNIDITVFTCNSVILGCHRKIDSTGIQIKANAVCWCGCANVGQVEYSVYAFRTSFT